jgi:hypothetical protein
MHAYTIPVWLIFPAALFILVLAFIGPTLVAIIRKVDGLGEFMLYNAVCFVMPVGLIVIWVMAFTWPRREPDVRYVPYPPPMSPSDYRKRTSHTGRWPTPE